MLHLCDQCQSSEYLLEQFSKFNINDHKDELGLSDLINYGLNPIAPIIYENLRTKVIEKDVDRHLFITLEQICQFQRNFNTREYLQYDFLYGWDYLIKYFSLANNQASQSHYNIFKLISQEHNQPLFRVLENMNLDQTMDFIYQKCQQLLKEIQIQDENEQLAALKSKLKINDLLLQFRVQQFNCLFNDIEKVFANNYIPNNQNIQNIFYQYFKYKILFSALIQQDNIDISNSQIYFKYTAYISIELISINILPQFNISHKFWEFNFKMLQYPQRISLITNIIDRFRSNQLPLFNLLLLAKKLKIMKEYYLSLILFSLFRSLSSKKSQHLSYVQYQMGKLCLYLKQFEDSFNLYKESLSNLDQLNIKNINSLKLKQKILMKIIIISIFTNHKGTRKQAIEIFMKEFVINGSKKNEVSATSSQAAFVFYISDLFYENNKIQLALSESQIMLKYCSFILSISSYTLPTQTLQKKTDCQELKKSIIFQNSSTILESLVNAVSKNKRSFMIDRQNSQSLYNKSEQKIDMPEFPEKSNIFNTSLQLLLLIYTNFQSSENSLKYTEYLSNKEKITIVLQSMNKQTLDFLPTILKECQITRQEQNIQKYQYYYDKFYNAHIFMYLRQYPEAEFQINSINCQDLFKQFQKTNTSDQQQFNNEYLRLQTRCMIGLGQLNLPKFQDSQMSYEVGCYYYKLFVSNKSQFQYAEESIKCFNEAITLSSHIKTKNRRNSYHTISLNHVQKIDKIITGSIINVEQKNNGLFQIPVFNNQITQIKIIQDVGQINQIKIVQNVGYLSDLLSIIKDRKFNDQNQLNYINTIIAQIQNSQNYIGDMRNDFKFLRKLSNQTHLIQNNGELFTLKTINIDCDDENRFLEDFQKVLLEILCLLRIRELDRIECCQLIQFKYELRNNHLEIFLLMKYFDTNYNIKNQIIQIMDAIRILNENNIFINHLSACSIYLHNNQPIFTDFSHATFVIDSLVYKVQSQKNQIALIQNDVYYFGCLIYEIITGKVLFESDVKNSQQIKSSLDLVEDQRMKRIIELATLPSLQRPKMIELRLLIYLMDCILLSFIRINIHFYKAKLQENLTFYYHLITQFMIEFFFNLNS
ncbi:hypothetical protein pb186bvf_014512 [Paramecium bursaria]